MARPLRIELAGGLYHGLSRGNERRAIVRNDADRQWRLDWLQRTVEVYGWRLHEGVQPPTVDFHRSLQPIQSPLAIRVVANDSAALVATRQPVVQSPRQFDSQRSCHAPKIPPFQFRVNT